MTHTEPLRECATCSRPVRTADAEALGWRYRTDGIDVHLVCALCAYCEFLSDAPTSEG